MKTKRGMSLVVLIITILVMTILAGIIIVQTDNALEEAKKDDFVVELGTIEDKAREYYLLMGTLPVKSGVEYTANEIKAKIPNSANQTLIASEINTNEDTENRFLIVDLALMQIETNERGKNEDETDIFVITSNTLNVYYLNGVEIDGVMRFSLATLTDKNIVEVPDNQIETQVSVDDQLRVIKSTNVWTNEIRLTIKNNLSDDETLNYSIGDATPKVVPENNIIIINSSNMTDDEKQTFSTSKNVEVKRLKKGTIVETKQISIENLDITIPELGTLEMADTSDANHNTVTINVSDEGDSGVKALYYDYVSVVVQGEIEPYYLDRSRITVNDLISFGKITNDGTIKLTKNIKSIVVIAVDNAGNVSDTVTYTIDDTYLAT